MTTNAAWLAGIQAMTVTGVNRHYDEPPTSLNTADLPAAWPQQFDVDNSQIIYSCNDLNKARHCNYYVALSPTAQNLQGVNYAAVVEMVDNLETAIEALTVMEFVTYTIRSVTVQVAGVDYWALEVVMTGSNSTGGGNG